MSGEEMNSPSILMNLAPAAAAAPATAGAEQSPAGTGGFDQALASVQSETRVGADAQPTAPAAVELASSLLVRGTMPAVPGSSQLASVAGDDVEIDSDAAEDAVGSGAAAILAQMLAGTMPPADAEAPPVADAATQAIASQATPPAGRGAKPVADVASGVARDGEDGSSASGASVGTGLDPMSAALEAPDSGLQPGATGMLQEKAFELPPTVGQSPQASSQGGNPAQSVVQAAVSAMRDVIPASQAPAPAHASLREPVGTARWADELGNHLVLMSVRGQQQGSLTLTPEHLGPVEVQISMNRDTANVWFGAQHADTRTALAEAMPRLRELLASSGLSLGQSGVSEQAPRGNQAAPAFPPGGVRSIDAGTVVETSAPAWRVWRPGHIDTYA